MSAVALRWQRRRVPRMPACDGRGRPHSPARRGDLVPTKATSASRPTPPGRLHGQALIAALLVITVLAASGLLAGGELRARAAARAHARSIDALATARAALIGYAISYAETHRGEGYGFLPCPDGGNSGSTPIGACGARGTAAIGRLPWRTLGLPELRDGWGECLWYAVAGSAKHNPKPLALNWDSPGQFRPLDPEGDPQAVGAGDGLAIAVVFAPGPVRSGQTRPSSRGSGCSGSDSATTDLPHYLDHAHPRTATSVIVVPGQGLQPGDDDAPNDLAIWIGIDDVFDALRRRHDHATHLDALLARSLSALRARLGSGRDAWLARHARLVGQLAVGVLPSAETLGIPADERGPIDDWHEQMHFAACPDGSACIDVARPDGGQDRCRAVLAFGGERARSGASPQSRTTPAERADLAAYFEDRNPVALRHGIPHFEGGERFIVPDRSQPATGDVIRCLP